MVPEAHRRLDLVHVLPALAAGAHRRDLDVLVGDDDVDVFVGVGGHVDGGEGRLTGVVRVERAHPHEAVHARFRCAGSRTRCRPRTRWTPRRCRPRRRPGSRGSRSCAARSPSGGTCASTSRPVLRVGPARARVDGEDRVGDDPRDRRACARARPCRGARRSRTLRLAASSITVARHLSAAPSSRYSARVGDISADLRGELELRLGLRALAQRLLRCFVVVPEARARGSPGQVFEQALESRDVKDAPLAHHGAS
jgi:hypothetical protein